MDPITPQAEQPLVPLATYSNPHRHFLNKKFAITLGILILLGAGAYVGIWYWQKQQTVVVATPTPTLGADETAGWKTYVNTQYGFEFKYPNNFLIQENVDGARITHGVPYQHSDTCDMKGDSQPLTQVVDFNSAWKMFNGDMGSSVAKDYFYPKDIFENGQFKLSPGFVDTYSSGGLSGYRFRMGAEGCGVDTYYFSIDANHTLVIKRPFNPERTPLITDYKKILALPGVMTPEQEDKIFDQMLTTFKSKDSASSIIYKNNQYGFSIPLTSAWKGYTVLNSQWEGAYLNDNNKTIRGPKIILRHPQWATSSMREDLPVMIFTLDEWRRVTNDKVSDDNISVGAAPIPPSILGQNSKYVIALPARYNFDSKAGWEEVDKLAHSLEAFDPAP
ncbi:MAG: hypothetical protein KBC81_00335 [Candidatus Pacebacteria bacterium]|nr:hypothetical protein [Candidatus Paceibacterota bacterium]